MKRVCPLMSEPFMYANCFWMNRGVNGYGVGVVPYLMRGVRIPVVGRTEIFSRTGRG